MDEVRKEPLKLPERWVGGFCVSSACACLCLACPPACPRSPARLLCCSFQWCDCNVDSDAELQEVGWGDSCGALPEGAGAGCSGGGFAGLCLGQRPRQCKALPSDRCSATVPLPSALPSVPADLRAADLPLRGG